MLSRYGTRGTVKPPCRRWGWAECKQGFTLSVCAESGNCERVELPGIKGAWVCGRGWHWGKAGALCAYQIVWSFVLKALGHHWWVVSRRKTKSARALCPCPGGCGEVGISGSELKEPWWDATPQSVHRMFLPERTLLSKRDLSRQTAVLCPRNCTRIGIPPVQILKIPHFKNKVFFVETRENMVFFRK